MHTHAGSQGYANPILGYPGVSRLEVYEVVNNVGRFSSGQLRERNCSTSPSGPNLGAVGSLCITRGTFPGAHGLGGTEVNRVVGGWFLWWLQVGCVLSRSQRIADQKKLIQILKINLCQKIDLYRRIADL